MVQVTVINNTDRQVITVGKDTTIREAFVECDVDFESGYKTIDGAQLKPGDINATFADLGYTSGSSCRLVSVIKADNASK